MVISDMNLGIVLGSAAAVLSIFSAMAALYLWAVKSGRHKFDSVDPQSRTILPWLAPLLLPTFIILCLGIVAGLFHGYEERSWQKASQVVLLAWVSFMILMFWLRMHKKV